MRPSQPEAFLDSLIIRLLRLAVQPALGAGRYTGADLQKLLRVAAFRECRARGMVLSEIAIELGMSPANVKNWGRESREIGDGHFGFVALRRVLRQMAKGPVSEADIDGLFNSGSIDFGRLSLRLLCRYDLAEPCEGGGHYRLTARAAAMDDDRWQAPLNAAEAGWQAAFQVVTLLSIQPSTRKQLEEDLIGGVEPETLEAALELLEAAGALQGQDGGPFRSRRYTLARRSIKLVPPTAEARLRTGLLSMVHHLGLFLDAVRKGGDRPEIGQRSFLFQARPADLASFVIRHREAVVRELETVEADSDGDPHAIPCLMTWAIGPVERG